MTKKIKNADLIDDIEYWIWQMIDERFAFDRKICDEVVEGFDHFEKEREWVGLSYRDVMGIFEYWDSNRDSSLVEFNTLELCELFELVEAKLKEKNT